jgi:ABC-type lipoprotein release transport system permease subunit
MAAVLLRARADLRNRWRAWLGLALLVGLFAGAVIAAAAGARRTDTAYPRLLRSAKAPDVMVFSEVGGDSTFAKIPPAELARLPEVAEVGTGASLAVVRPAAVTVIVPADATIGSTMFRRKMLAGRQPRADRADEMSISFVLAQARHLGVGDRLQVDVAAPSPSGQPATRTFTFHIVGVDAAPSEFPPQHGTGVQAAWATPAFYKAQSSDTLSYGLTAIRLRRGPRDLPAVHAAIERLSGGKPVQAFVLADQAANTQRSIHLQAAALWVLGGLLGLAAALVLTQLLVRQSSLEASEYPSLRALGMSSGELWAVGMARALAVGGVGAALAVVVACLLSPALPVGLARTAEPRPGFAFDSTALGLGALATFTFVALAATVPALRAARFATRGAPAADTGGGSSRSLVVGFLSRVAVPPSVTTGVRFALEPGRGRNAVPVRSAIAGAVVGVTALAAALAFTTSIGHLLDSPRLYGVTWDARETSIAGPDVTPGVPALQSDRRVSALSIGYSGVPLTIGRVRVDGLAMDVVKGTTMLPVAVEGRRPAKPDEIMLGSKTLSELHAHVGSTVRVSVASSGSSASFRVVGRGVFPSLSDALGLGQGAATSVRGLTRGLGPGVTPPPAGEALVRFGAGVDKTRAIAELDRSASAAGAAVLPPDKPDDLVNFGRVKNLPGVLGALVGGLAVATLAHLLVTSTRRRRHDLAILKILGFAPADVRRAVAWQATTLAVLAVVVGVPLGIGVGRWAWLLFAHQLGIVAAPSVSLVAVVGLIAATVVVANLAAALPGRAAARLHPARVLRSE